MIAMILAAGRGERLRPVTDSIPKALVEIGGVSLIEYHIEMLAAAGATTVVVNLGWLGENIVEKIGGGDRFGVQVVYSPEYDNILETGGGIQRALPLLGAAPFWVINADIHTDFAVSESRLRGDALAHLVLVPTPSYKSGDFNFADGRVENSESAEYTFSGIACYRPEFFEGLPSGRYSIVPHLRAAADLGRLSGELYDGSWSDVGTVERLEALNSPLGV